MIFRSWKLSPLVVTIVLAGALLPSLILAGPADLAGELERINSMISAGQFREALDAALETADHAATAGATTDQATALLRISDALYYLGRRAETLPPMEQALALYQAAADTAGIGRTFYSLAYYFERTDPERMFTLLSEGKKYASAVQDKRLLMNIANAAGVARWNQGNYDAATIHFEESIALARERRDDAALASANQNLGLIDYHRGDGRKALEHYRQALSALEKTGNSHGVAVVLGNMGNAYLALGDPESGRECYDRALFIDRENDYQRGISTMLENLAGVNFLLGRVDLARDQFTEALAISERSGDIRTQVFTRLGLGLIALEEGRPEQGLRQYATALELARNLGDPYALIDPLQRLAELAFRSGDDTAGREYLREARQCAADCGATYSGGILAAMLGERLAAEGQVAAAIATYEKALTQHEATHIRTHVFLWCADLAALYRQQGDPVAAEAQYRLSLAAIEDLDAVIATGDFRRYLFNQAAGVYRDFADWTADRGDLAGAWRILEQGRARDLSFRLLQNRARAVVSGPEQASLSRLAALQKRWREESLTPDQRSELLLWISSAEAQYDRTRWRPSPDPLVPLATSSYQPDSGTLLLTYSLGNDTLQVFSAWDGTYQRRQVPAARALMRRCSIFSDLVSDPATGDTWRAASRSLAAVLLAPEMAAHRPDRVVIMPDRELWGLPFTALTLFDGTLLAEAAAVSLTPAVRTLAEISRRPPAARDAILAVACTRYSVPADSSSGLVNIPAAGDEAARVARRSDPSVLLVNTSEGSFKAQDLPRMQIIHFASHILADPRRPNRSGIILGPDQDNDGVLRAREIYRLPLDTRLTVVSGCRSGDGGTVPGEGLLGLSHALLSAGSRAVVLSRWNLADRGAAFFMEKMYDALGDNPADIALQQARLACLDSPDWRHPAYWSTYFLAGDGSQQCDFRPRALIRGLVLLGCGVLLALAAVGLGHRRNNFF